MILCLFAWHLKQVDDNEYDWGFPIGAMAIIAAAVSSRAFSQIASIPHVTITGGARTCSFEDGNTLRT